MSGEQEDLVVSGKRRGGGGLLGLRDWVAARWAEKVVGGMVGVLGRVNLLY